MTPEEAVQVTEYCAFMDVLGYSSLLLDPALGSDATRLTHLLEMWEAATVAIDSALQTHPQMQSKLFSDSLYASGDDLGCTVLFAASVFMHCYYYYERRASDWMPWLRAGIGAGWMVSMVDTTLSQVVSKPEHAFNNPAGPAVAHAYQLANDSKFKGMRLLIPRDLKEQVWPELKYVDFASPSMTHNARLLTGIAWPSTGVTTGRGEIHDVPWWLLIEQIAPRDRVMRAHAWQARNSPAAQAHYDASMRLLQS